MGNYNDIAYIWIGGSKDAINVADRFNWNVASNWIKRIPTPWDAVPQTYQFGVGIPGPGDHAYVGVAPTIESNFSGGMAYQGLTYSVRAPLLFGGFSGDANNGGWTSGSYGATGTTWTSSLSSFEIGTDDQSPNVDLQRETPPWRTNIKYPFELIGGGITYSVIQKMKTLKVDGMTDAMWDAILANRTSAQERGLVIKADNVLINKKVSSQTIYGTGYGYPQTGTTYGNLSITVRLVDNFGNFPTSYTSQLTETQKKDIRKIYTKVKGTIYNTSVAFVDSAIQRLELRSQGTDAVMGISKSDPTTSVSLQGCVVDFIDLGSGSDIPYNYNFDKNCVLNKIYCPCTVALRSGDIKYRPVLTTNMLDCQIEPYTVYKRMNNGIGWTGATLTNYVTIWCNESFNSGLRQSSVCPHVYVGKHYRDGITHISDGLSVYGNWSLNSYYSAQCRNNLIIEPGAFIQKLNIAGIYAYSPRVYTDLLYKISIGTVIVTQDAILDTFTFNDDPWRIGKMVGITLTGGMSTNKAGGFAGGNNTRFINYIVKSGINKRTNQQQSDLLLGSLDETMQQYEEGSEGQ